MSAATQRQTVSHDTEDTYRPWLDQMRREFQQRRPAPLFTTDADPDALWLAYLDAFPAEDRQYHNCHACRQFIQRFGALVEIDEAGQTASPIWHPDTAPPAYQEGVRQMARLVKKARVTGIFFCAHDTWGTPVTGPWCHFALTPPAALIWRSRTLTAGQQMAERKEDYRTVQTAIHGLSLPLLGQVVALLKSEALYRSEKVLGQAEWLYALKAAQEGSKGKVRENLTWRAIALAPAGFCHPKSSMIGTLLEDLESGMDFDTVARRWSVQTR